ncbi:Panacea domain-containing protein [Caldanaerobius polysaccharolyticus]|uniref:Panacea domain-containing protein n=1 Tax=Caldanaerobius polysaccharolyticus TaxID=44256 RepID=UPI00068A2F0A|nr:type II toxin-antitoxin system antitoxin SocA domain-containing protein [Caldanaerobius polysaccharolyticus]
MGKVVFLKGGLQVDKPSIFDVAKTFLFMDSMTHKKLQKLCYYAQAWHLALYNGERLFDANFEAWIHGPVCRELYNVYKVYGWDDIPKENSIPSNIDEETYEFLKVVFNTYGDFTGDELEKLTHTELPWKEAREGLEEWEPSHNVIKEETMQKFYWDIYEQSQND